MCYDTLFADAEFCEYSSEDFVGGNFAGYFAEVVDYDSDVFYDQICTQPHIQSPVRLVELGSAAHQYIIVARIGYHQPLTAHILIRFTQ